ncbi:MAG: VTC domain-containing protein, partial [Vicinamibacterales bacterium]
MMTRSTGMAADVSARPAVFEGERELKFTIPGGRVDLARRWLDALCRRDPVHPAAYVWTIYYDTPGFTALGEKINSDYLKLKVRLRWYSELASAPSGPAFVEAKMRVGAQREKVRVPAPYTAAELAGWDLQDARLRELPALLRMRSVVIPDQLRPVLLLRYRRDRFVEPISRMRVSLDGEIAAVAINPALVSTLDSSALDTGVLEAKGTGED